MKQSREDDVGSKADTDHDSNTTFLSADDFHRAQNMSFSETETRPVVVSPLNDPEMHYIYYEGDMMIQESDEKKVIKEVIN